ncbi:response regulator transcription factor [Luteibacter aegosomatissinici]|uniref:response regulator transcription factor n=1 Tax=Luteibacter aegosomatissinici TaxID=2911539 RepID=UPI001FFAEA8E|nr:DNA-binding response regulator [Luteibacter aegosomatissinici]UPG93834.1 DNA-binding response regulator [Luteibacter aegosomatissinici]
MIDDAPEGIRDLVQALRAEPFRVSLATSAAQGYQRAQVLSPDLILLDVRMPGTDGFTLCRLLQELQPGRDTPILFLTAAASEEERLAGLSQGAVDYILKSCSPAELLARVRIHLRLTRRGVLDEAPHDMPMGRDEVVLRAAMRFIGQRLAEPLGLDAIAEAVGTYDKRLSAIFRQRLGTTVFAWIREERLRKSRELLTSTTLGMQDIASTIGFSSAANFATAFKERLGVTPGEYRKAAADESARDAAAARG